MSSMKLWRYMYTYYVYLHVAKFKIGPMRGLKQTNLAIKLEQSSDIINFAYNPPPIFCS